MNWWLLSIPFISGFIGWITNWVAIKMLFHPREPKKILGITFHGIFPKRQKQFAEKLGKLVSAELISFDEIEQKIAAPENLEKIVPLLDEHINIFLRDKLKDQMPMVAMFLGEKTIAEFKAVFMKELQLIFPDLMKRYMDNLQHDLNLETIVINKVANFSTNKLESILNGIMSSEFRFVEIIGAVLGFLIGVVQVFITVFTNNQ